MILSSRTTVFRALYRRFINGSSVLAGCNPDCHRHVCRGRDLSTQMHSRLTFYENMMINQAAWGAQIKIEEFGKRIGFPVRDCMFSKEALTVNPDPDELTWNIDLRKIGTEALRLILAKYFFQLRYYTEGRSESVSAANRVLDIPSLFRQFVQHINLQEHLIYDDHRTLNLQLADLKCDKEGNRTSKVEVPLPEVSEELLRDVSLSVAGAIYLDSADTAEVRSIFFPFFQDVLEKERRATMVRLGINYEDFTPDAVRRRRMKSIAEQYGDIDDIDGLLRALR